MNDFQIIHKSKNRVRFRQPNLSQNCDILAYENEISKINGVKNVRINGAIKSVAVEFDGKADEILDQISRITLQPQSAKTEISQAPMIQSLATLLSLGIFGKNSQISTLLTLLSGLNLFKDGAKELFKEGLTSKVLEAMAVGISLSRRDLVAANSTNLLINIGEYIEETTAHKSDDLIKELAKPNIEFAWIEKNINGKKELQKIHTKDIKVGDIVVVGSGETIAIDGYIVEGSARINQTSMTGEAGGVKKEHGQRVMSGTVVEEGKIKIWTEFTGDNTSTQRIKKYIENSLNEKSATALKATKIADKLVPVTLSLAGLAYFINRNMTSVASVLQADYSCALKLATPVAFKSSISKAGKIGILIKGAKSIEALAKADTFVFDKTGTLTNGILKVADVVSFDKNWSKAQILDLAASAEEHYFHPIAEAIVNAAKKKGFNHKDHGDVEFIVAHGLKTHYLNKEVLIGSRHFLQDDEKIEFANFTHDIQSRLDEGFTLLYIAYERKLLGIIAMIDELRDNAKTTIATLKALGAKEIIMLTGDIESKANAIASQLGIDKVFANMLPTDKANVVEMLRKNGKNVVFCGDGINDAPSLIKANVGISMKRGADIAKATADISLLKDDIFAVAQAKQIANETMSLIDANFKATLGINSAILFGATLGKLSPINTAILHNGTTIALLLNSMKGVKFEQNFN